MKNLYLLLYFLTLPISLSAQQRYAKVMDADDLSEDCEYFLILDHSADNHTFFFLTQKNSDKLLMIESKGETSIEKFKDTCYPLRLTFRTNGIDAFQLYDKDNAFLFYNKNRLEFTTTSNNSAKSFFSYQLNAANVPNLTQKDSKITRGFTYDGNFIYHTTKSLLSQSYPYSLCLFTHFGAPFAFKSKCSEEDITEKNLFILANPESQDIVNQTLVSTQKEFQQNTIILGLDKSFLQFRLEKKDSHYQIVSTEGMYLILENDSPKLSTSSDNALLLDTVVVDEKAYLRLKDENKYLGLSGNRLSMVERREGALHLLPLTEVRRVRFTDIPYATFYTEEDVVMPKGLTGNTVSLQQKGETQTIRLNADYPEGSLVPAKTPLVITGGELYSSYSFVATGTITPLTSSDNLLHGQVKRGPIVEETVPSYYYKLTTDENKNAGFYRANAEGTAFTLNHNHRAYLVLPKDKVNGAVRGFNFDGTTHIGITLANEQTSLSQQYDLSGRKINERGKGVVISKKKKIFKK